MVERKDSVLFRLSRKPDNRSGGEGTSRVVPGRGECCRPGALGGRDGGRGKADREPGSHDRLGSRGAR